MSDPVGLEIAQPNERDARMVMEWRNDPTTLAASFEQQPKQWPQFFEEYCQRYFWTAHLAPLFVLLDGERVAFLRFRHDSDSDNGERLGCEISINVAPEHRGKGLGLASLKAAETFVRGHGYDDLFAEIKTDNGQSRKIFEQAGYEFACELNKCGSQVWRFVRRLTPLSLSTSGVFVIAEAGSNWRMGTPQRDSAMARALIDVAVAAGADAVKFQTYRPEAVYVENAGKSDYLATAGIQEEIREIFADLAMPYELVGELAEYCSQVGIQFMSTPFSREDFEAVDPHVSIHKIASYELSHIRLIELAALSGKPLIISTGAAAEEDVTWAVNYFRERSNASITLLQCTAKYPADSASMNLRALTTLKSRFGCPVGLSDHSRDPVTAPIAAVALGASVIEKHYTLDNRLPGPDHSFALNPGELKQMVDAIREATLMRGSGVKCVLDSEQELYSFARRGVQAVRNIPEGEHLLEGVNIDILRPGKQNLGIHPRYIADLEGKPAKRVISVGEGVQRDDW